MSASLPSEKTNILHTPQPCDVCGAKVSELRRGRCWGCYSKWADTRPVGMGAACVMCNDRRREHLRSMELMGHWMPCCHNCSARIARLMPMPATLDEVRTVLGRERRADERRIGKPDTRIFRRDRRGLERRSVGHAVDGDDLMLCDDDILIIEVADDDELPVSGEETRIQMAPESPSAAVSTSSAP
jgi:hypothetical protein